MPATRGILIPYDVTAEQRSVFAAFVREVFVNETPLLARLQRVKAEGEVYNIISYDVRGRDYTVSTGGISNVATTLPINDASPLLVGDVLGITTSGVEERVEITGNINVTASPNTVDVKRAREGTTAVAHVATDVIRLYGNSRTGGEIDQEASRNPRTVTPQYVQTFQYPVQVGGKANYITNVALPAGVRDLFTQGQQVKMVEMVRDIEETFYYGLGEAPSAGGRTKTKGILTQIASGNVTTTTATSYTPLQFVTDVISKAMAGGGKPDICLVSNDFTIGLTTWGLPVQQITNERTTVLGLGIESVLVPFMGMDPVRFIRCPQLKTGTAIALTSEEVQIRPLREEMWLPRGIPGQMSRGDAYEGDWICDMSIQLINPSHHAARTGISTFAAA